MLSLSKHESKLRQYRRGAPVAPAGAPTLEQDRIGLNQSDP